MKNDKPTAAQPHQGITMHRIRVGGDSMGLLAALGAILVCVVGFPQARGFLVASVIAGLVAAIVFRLWFSRKPSDVEPLSLKHQSATNQPPAKNSAADDTDLLKRINGNQFHQSYQW